jgi:hypothetical protein
LLKSLINNLLGRAGHLQIEEEEPIVVFTANEEGKEWKRDNILIVDKGLSGYLVYIYNQHEITSLWPEETALKAHEDTIICDVPNLVILMEFLTRLYNDRPPRFYTGDY